MYIESRRILCLLDLASCMVFLRICYSIFCGWINDLPIPAQIVRDFPPGWRLASSTAIPSFSASLCSPASPATWPRRGTWSCRSQGTRCVAATPWPPWAMTTSSSASLWGAAVVWMGRVELVGWVLCRESPIKLVIEDILWWNFVTDSKHHPGGPAAIDPDLPTNSSDVLLGPCPRWWLVQQHGECRSSHRGIYTTWRISPFHPRRQEFLGRELGWQGLLLHALCLHHRSSTGPGQWLQVGQPCSIHRSL